MKCNKIDIRKSLRVYKMHIDFINLFIYLLIMFTCSCAGEPNPVKCTSGTYSGGGLAACAACTVGSYCPFEKTIYPIPCPLGTYSNETGLAQCKTCPAGYKCANTSLTPVVCDDGTYSLSGRSECIQCPAGKK